MDAVVYSVVDGCKRAMNLVLQSCFLLYLEYAIVQGRESQQSLLLRNGQLLHLQFGLIFQGVPSR